MLISEKFVFTPSIFPEGLGAKHPINKLVEEAVGGQAPELNIKDAAGLAALGKPVVALVCDPRSWYLALWRQGCAAKGPVFRRLTDPAKWEQLRKRRSNRLAQNEEAEPEIPAEWGAEHARTFWYGDSQSVPAFKEWLRAVVGVRVMRGMVSAEYQRSTLSRNCGLMTYEFSQLFIHNPNELGALPTNWRGLHALNKAKGLVSHAVRAEDFAETFLPAMEALGVALSDSSRAAIARERGRNPVLRREWERFFDEDMLKLLIARERFICVSLRYRLSAPGAHREADDAAGDGQTPGSAGAARRRAARGSVPAPEASPAPTDPAEIARQARIAEIRQLQEERLAQRRAAGKLPARGGGRSAGRGARSSSPEQAAGLTTHPRLADFDED